MAAADLVPDVPVGADHPPSAAPTLLLIDGHALIHRAFHALPEDLTTKSGEVINATYGFALMLMKAIEDVHPDYLAVTFDRPTPTFRHAAFTPYKAHRPTLPDHLRPQFGRVRQLVESFHIPIYELDGFEADDVLGTLAKQAEAAGARTIILTGDMDTLQLVTAATSVMTARRGVSDILVFDPAAVVARYGVGPDRVPDWKALTGDTSDNIPGVPGIGEKTATKLLQTYGKLEDVLAHVAELPARQRQLLTDFADQARQSKWLATIVTDVPVTLRLDDAHTMDFDRAVTRQFFREMEFNSLIDRLERLGRTVTTAMPTDAPSGVATDSPVTTPLATLPGVPPHASAETGPAQMALFALPAIEDASPSDAPAVAVPLATRTIVVTDAATLQVLATSMRHADLVAFDVETDSTDDLHAHLVGISLALGAGEAFYIPVGHRATPTGEEPGPQLSLDQVRTMLGPPLADPTVRMVGHNAKYDMNVLHAHGIDVQGVVFDTMVAAYLIDPGRRGLGLKEQAFEVLGIVMTPIVELIGRGAKQITMAQVPIHTAAAYASADADMTWRLAAPLEAKVREAGLWDLFQRLEMPLIPVLARMERVGILVDLAVLERMSVDLAEQVAALEQAIYQAVGHEFNINSNKQLAEVLFTELHLPAGRKLKTGYSVDADTLEGLRGAHPALDNLLEYRTLMKLRSTYVEGLRALRDPRDGRVHTSFNQTIASSGRLSSSNPNLQNIPIRTELGRSIRRAFIAAPGHQLVAADYAQVELRILAHMTREPALVEAFAADEDIHRVTASRLYHVPPEAITKDQRRMAKTITYAIIYGQSPFGLARTAGMPQDEARHFIQTFEESFPQVKEYVRATMQQARQQGYVQTLLGRKRFFPGLLNLPLAQRQAAEREAINMPIQGTNADIIKLAMISFDAAIRDLNLRTRLILQVHDELVCEVPDDEIELVISLMRAHMEGALELSVPLRVEIKAGRDWYSTEAVDG